MAAVEHALASGFGVEVDVRLSADGVAVIHHDSRLERTTTGVGPLTAWSARELRGLRLRGTDEPIPSLAEVLRLVGGQAVVMLDLKSGTHPASRARMAQAVVRAVDGYAGPVEIVGFDALLLRGLGALLPGATRGQTVGIAGPNRPARLLIAALGRPAHGGWLRWISAPQFLSVHVSRLNGRDIQRLRRSGLPVTAWTIRTAAQLHVVTQLADRLIVEGDAARHLAAHR